MSKKASKKTTTKTKKVAKVSASQSYLDRIESEVQLNQSRMSLVLGGLIILVIGVLIFNYFNKTNKGDVGTAQKIEVSQNADVAVDALPGKYTVKEGDTLFTIADKYYKDGYQYPEIAKANNLINVDSIETGQVLEIPKLDTTTNTVTATPTPIPTEQPVAIVPATPAPEITSTTTDWGSAITGYTYTVQEGDWLSTIAARAYNGDVMAYTKIAQANNITNPDVIEPGTILTLPR